MKKLGPFVVAFVVLAVVSAKSQGRGVPPIGLPGPPPAVLMGPPPAVLAGPPTAAIAPSAAAMGPPPAVVIGPPPSVVMGPPPAVVALPPSLGLPHGPAGGLPAAAGSAPGLLGPAANAPGQIVRETVQAATDAVGRPSGAPILAANLARDEHGALIVRAEVLALGPDDASMRITQRLGFTVVRRDSLGALGLATATLRAPEGMSAVDALVALRRADPRGTYDYAHVYNPSGGANVAASTVAFSPVNPAAGTGLRVGMIDGGIEVHHPAFRTASLVTEAFAQNASAHGTIHGTAVASLLIGHERGFSGYLPGATLYAADVFAGAPDGGSADIIARALNWLAANNIAVTNISLAGPPNLLLEAAVKAFIARGHTLVAAAGNGGPAAPPSYPAAYPGVIAVTSVDSDKRPELDANRGAQFAALGVDVRAAMLPDGYARVTGTSYAAPAVTARFALVLHSPDAADARMALRQFSQEGVPLGTAKDAPKYLETSTSITPPPGLTPREPIDAPRCCHSVPANGSHGARAQSHSRIGAL